jgi:hypothetical protein
MESVRSLVLPPGKLGLELEASSCTGAKGLKVRGWSNPVFQLSSLPTGTVLRSIDGISVEDLDFLVAVKILRDSQKRVLEVYSPKDMSPEERACIGKQISIIPDAKGVKQKQEAGKLQQQKLNGSFADENQHNSSVVNGNSRNGKMFTDDNQLDSFGLVDREVNDDIRNTSSFFKENKEGLKLSASLSPRKTTLPTSEYPHGYAMLRSPLQDKSADVLPQCNQAALGVISEQAVSGLKGSSRVCHENLIVSRHTIYTEESPTTTPHSVCVNNDKLALNQPVAVLAGCERQEILDLKAEQREADAKIMLLKYQMGKMKKANTALSNKPEPEAIVVSAQTEVFESLLLHRHRFCSALTDLTNREHPIDLSLISQPLQESVRELCPRESRDVGLQCTLLSSTSVQSAKKASQLEAEIAQQERFIQKLKLQLRANVEAQINMHELASFKEIIGDNRKIMVKSARLTDSSVQSDLSEYDSDGSNGSASSNFVGMNIASERLLQADLEHLDDTQDSPVHATAIQAIAMNYASPVPLSANKIVVNPVVTNDTEINAADRSTLADILDTIDKTPDCKSRAIQPKESLPLNSVQVESGYIDLAWTRWARNGSKPVDMGLSPASFKDHLHRLRGANTLMRDDISRFRETLKRLSR